MANLIDKLHWLGHSGFVVRNGKVIYFDPFKIGAGEKADLVLIGHDHFDHCSPDDVRKIVKASTIIVTVPDCRTKLADIAGKTAGIKLVKPGDSLNLEGIGIEVVPAYNLDKDFHPKSKHWVGFILEMDGEKLYHAGDTDLIPEMSSVRCDIALLPVSGSYCMNAEEAAQAAEKIKPKIAIPMHYGETAGSPEDGKRFAALCKCAVKILKQEN